MADVVGLQNHYACAIAKHLKNAEYLCPPGIVGDRNKNSGWKIHRRVWSLRLGSSFFGRLENTLEFVNKAKDIEVVIIDEATVLETKTRKTMSF